MIILEETYYATSLERAEGRDLAKLRRMIVAAVLNVVYRTTVDAILSDHYSASQGAAMDQLQRTY